MTAPAVAARVACRRERNDPRGLSGKFFFGFVSRLFFSGRRVLFRFSFFSTSCTASSSSPSSSPSSAAGRFFGSSLLFLFVGLFLRLIFSSFSLSLYLCCVFSGFPK